MIGCRILGYSTLFLLVLFGGVPSRADEPPQIRVGRIAIAEGGVAVRAAQSTPAAARSRPAEWTDAGVNYPIAAAMSVRTAAQGQAVLRIGAELIALAGGTEVELAHFDRLGTQLTLRRGRIAVRVLEFDPARCVEIDIPRGGIWLQTAGDYEIAAGDDNEPARLAVSDGRARFAGKGLDATVAAGSAVLLHGDDPVAALPGGAGEEGLAARWQPTAPAGTDRMALHHVSSEMAGYDALDGHGSWESVAGYGVVWFPADLPGDWAPYRNGQWRWVDPWGWTWLDDQPWGFAPSHYGRWALIGGEDPESGRWGWVPGKRAAHPAFMPAAVAFLGTAGVGLSYPDAFSPAVAWFPLAPGEVYWPGTLGPAANDDPPAALVTGKYRYRRFASIVPRAVFLGGKPVAPALIDLPPRRLENAPLLGGSPQIAPPPPRPALPAVAARNVDPSPAKAAQRLPVVVKPGELKPRDNPLVRRAAAEARAAPGKPPRAVKTRPPRPRVIGLPKPRHADMRQADARRR